jgi:hypothetical protein
MDIPVTYIDKNGTEKFNVILRDVQTNEKFHYNLFSVGKMLLKGYKLEGDKHSLTVLNKTRLIVLTSSFTRKIECFTVPDSLEHWRMNQPMQSYKATKAVQKL